MEKKILYVFPDTEIDLDGMYAMTPSERKEWAAKHRNECEIYTVSGFMSAFNNEEISDLGYLFEFEQEI